MHLDPSGEIAVEAIWATLKKMAISGAINLVTSFGAALISNQKFSLRDGTVAFIAGAGSGINPLIGGVVGGGYAAYSSYESGANIGGVILSGFAAFVCNACSLGGLSKYLEGLAKVFVETVFTSASNLLSAVIYKGVQQKTPKAESVPVPAPSPTPTPTPSPYPSPPVSPSSSSRYSTPFTPYWSSV